MIDIFINSCTEILLSLTMKGPVSINCKSVQASPSCEIDILTKINLIINK